MAKGPGVKVAPVEVSRADFVLESRWRNVTTNFDKDVLFRIYTLAEKEERPMSWIVRKCVLRCLNDKALLESALRMRET